MSRPRRHVNLADAPQIDATVVFEVAQDEALVVEVFVHINAIVRVTASTR